METILNDSTTWGAEANKINGNFNLFSDKEVVKTYFVTGTPLKEFLPADIYGWGSMAENPLRLIRKIIFKRDTTLNTKAGDNITLKMWGTNNPGIVDAELILTKLVSYDIYAALSDGESLSVDLEADIDVSSYDYLTVMLFYDAGLAVKQTKTGFSKGMFAPNSGGSQINFVGANEYGLYWEAEMLEGKKSGFKLEEFEAVELFAELNRSGKILNQARSLSINSYRPSFVADILQADKDIYVELFGDSISAWQSTMVKADEGVCDVPPLCDRKGFANRLFEVLKFGSPKYRRFDWGKASLVSFWDSRWTDDSAAYFTETGTWKTFFYGNQGRPANYHSKPEITTEIADEVCPIAVFHDSDIQRNIPKRVSNSSGASIQFAIPSNYEKADFIYNEHITGDACTIVITGGAGKVLVHTKQNDWGNAVEANGYVLDTVKHNTADGFNDQNGILQKRLYFKKINIADAETITITKSTDTSKYLSYWGVSYWGTILQPYALHMIAAGKGGHTLGELLVTRDSDIRSLNPDYVFLENTLINSLGATGTEADGSKRNQSVYQGEWTTLKTYLDTLNIPMLQIIPHLTPTNINNGHASALEYYRGIKGYLLKQEGVENVLDIEALISLIHNTYYSDMTYSSFVETLMYDTTTHPNEKGFDVYQAVLERLV